MSDNLIYVGVVSVSCKCRSLFSLFFRPSTVLKTPPPGYAITLMAVYASFPPKPHHP